MSSDRSEQSVARENVDRLAVAGIFMDLLDMETLEADRLARAASPRVLRRIRLAAKWHIRFQAAEAVRGLVNRIKLEELTKAPSELPA